MAVPPWARAVTAGLKQSTSTASAVMQKAKSFFKTSLENLAFCPVIRLNSMLFWKNAFGELQRKVYGMFLGCTGLIITAYFSSFSVFISSAARTAPAPNDR
jgi:hypothetical protein